MAAGSAPSSFADSSLLQRPSRNPLIFHHHRPISSVPFAQRSHLSSLQFQSQRDTGFGVAWKSKEEKGLLEMSRTQAVRHLTGSLTTAAGLRFAIVVARFNEIVTRPLLEGALDTFKKYSVKEEDVDVIWVPGCFEIGIVAEKLGKSGKYQAVVCIGAVVRGDTSHYDAVANSAASGVLNAGLNSGVPCIFGVLTCDDMDQALNRAGGKAGNKGSEAALTAVGTTNFVCSLLSKLKVPA